MHWCVYWQPGLDLDIEIAFYPNEAQARAKVSELIAECNRLTDDHEGHVPYWDITLLKVMGEVKQTYPNGDLQLIEKSERVI